ncbi:MAG TPA: hypothetical protein VK009_16460 [Chloroflexota bacterium]|nr:hypothetical protein [Chloroflexota bacterium]
MAVDVDTRLDELVAIASPYWAGEYEVVRTFFSKPRSKEEHIRWLRAQCWKEFWGTLDGESISIAERGLRGLNKLLAELDESPEKRHKFLHEAEEMYQEFHHYSALADILDDLEGRHVKPDELASLPEDQKLTAMRAEIARTEGELGAFVNKFSEGGGSSMYRAGMEIKGGELEERMAAAFRVIYDDEIEHMQTGAEGLRRVVHTPEEWEKCKRLVREVMRQRVRMRNDMFGQPLSEERLKEIDEGKIEPFHRDILTK